MKCPECGREDRVIFVDLICYECHLEVINEEDYQKYVEYHKMEAASCQN